MRPAYLPRRDSSKTTTTSTTSNIAIAHHLSHRNPSSSSSSTLTLAAPAMNVAQHDLLRLTAPDAANHLGGHLDMDFDPEMNFEHEGLLYVSSGTRDLYLEIPLELSYEHANHPPLAETTRPTASRPSPSHPPTRSLMPSPPPLRIPSPTSQAAPMSPFSMTRPPLRAATRPLPTPTTSS